MLITLKNQISHVAFLFFHCFASNPLLLLHTNHVSASHHITTLCCLVSSTDTYVEKNFLTIILYIHRLLLKSCNLPQEKKLHSIACHNVAYFIGISSLLYLDFIPWLILKLSSKTGCEIIIPLKEQTPQNKKLKRYGMNSRTWQNCQLHSIVAQYSLSCIVHSYSVLLNRISKNCACIILIL